MNLMLWGRSLVAGLTAVPLFASPVLAVDLPGPDVQVTATVGSTLSFSVTITELVPNTATPDPADTLIGPQVAAMDFSTLASNGTFDPDGVGPQPPQLRSLNSTKAFQVFFGLNAQQRPFTIKQAAGPLQSGVNAIPAGAFIVTPLSGVGGDPAKPLPANILKGNRVSAITGSLLTPIVLFSSSGGPADTMAATYGITDNPQLGATAPIPLDQPAGTYTTTIRFTATVT
jgi:hypothetical protein